MKQVFKKIIEFILKWLAKIYIFRANPYVIIIAGTTGRHWIKETVKNALEEKSFSARANKKNFNAEIGLPLSILGLPSGEGRFLNWLDILWQGLKLITNRQLPITDYLVLEMSVDKPDNMDYLLSIVKPNAAIITTITMIYAENFENLDEIAEEYEKLIKKLSFGGIAILNFDDERVKNLKNYFDGRVLTYGFSDGADFQAINVKKAMDGQNFILKSLTDSEVSQIEIKRFGNHHIYAALVKEIIKRNFKMSSSDFFSKMLK